MTNIYIMRHGETEWNRQRRFQGHHDSPLTERGIVQVKQLSKYLQTIPLTAIYASSCNRAVVTANIINSNKNLPLCVCNDLREINFGVWEGMTIAEVKDKFSCDYQKYFYSPEQYIPTNGGETIDAVRLRVLKKIEEIVSIHPDENVLIVVHGNVLRILYAHFKGYSLSAVWSLLAPPASLSMVVANDGNYKIDFWAKKIES